MEPLKVGHKAWYRSPWLPGCLLLLGIVCQSGCMGGTDLIMSQARPTVGVPSQIISNWMTEIQSPADPTHEGNPLPGLAGRIYLFSEKGDLPILADGQIFIELYDDGPGAHGADNVQNPPIVRCRYDKDALKKLEKHDPIGWGYTMFLPWDNYKPGVINKVRLKVWFERPTGERLYGDTVSLKLGGQSRPPIEVTHRQMQVLPSTSGAFLPGGDRLSPQISSIGSTSLHSPQQGMPQQQGMYSQPVR